MSCDIAERYVTDVPGWGLLDNATKLKRTYKFNNFVDALSFTQQVGELCEKEGHHPDITLGWGYAKVVFQTHKINGLHENDFIMAAKGNELAAKLNEASSKLSGLGTVELCRSHKEVGVTG